MLKIKSVETGSVIVKYDIVISDEMVLGDVNPEQLLKAINDKQTELFATGQMDLGAPLLDVSSNVVNTVNPQQNETQEPVPIISGGAVVADSYEPIVITDVQALKDNKNGLDPNDETGDASSQGETGDKDDKQTSISGESDLSISEAQLLPNIKSENEE